MAQSAIRRSVIPPMAGERQVSTVKPHETISCSKINTDTFGKHGLKIKNQISNIKYQIYILNRKKTKNGFSIFDF